MSFRMLWVAVFLLACHPVYASELSPHARRVVDAVRQLRAIGLPERGREEAGPPANVPALLRTLNAELKALILDDLNDQNRHGIPEEDEILDQLRSAGWEEIPSHKWDAYGEIRQIDFDWKPEYDPGVLIISTQLWIPCGNADPDSAIYVFQGRGRKWNLILATDSDFDLVTQNDYSGMQYRISPPDDSGKWFLVVGHVPPECRRTESALRYKVLRPGSNPEKPLVISSAREVIDKSYDPPFQIRAETDWFAVTESKKRKLDGDPGIAIFRYEVGKDSVRRVQPLALSPEDFLDQWAQLSWEDAKGWAKDAPELDTWHTKLASLVPGSVEIESARMCTGSAETDQMWLLELSIDQLPNPSIGAQSLFIEIAKRNGIFQLERVRTSHPDGCLGRTPLTAATKSELPSW